MPGTVAVPADGRAGTESGYVRGGRVVAEFAGTGTSVFTGNRDGTLGLGRLAPGWEAAPFTGRVAELALVELLVAGFPAGRQLAIEVVGPAGAGKTALIAEALRRMAPRRLTVCAGSAAEVHQRIPFQVFRHALGDRFQAALAGDDRLWSSAVSGAGSSAASSAIEEQPAELLSDEQLRLYRIGRQHIAEWAGGGLILVLDDLQWADWASRELIGHLLRYPVPAPLLLVLSHRPEHREAGAADPLGRTSIADWSLVRLVLGRRPEPVQSQPAPTPAPVQTQAPTPATQVPPLAALTSREREIARLAATGATTRSMARQLFVSPRTVDAHLARIYRKLDVRSRAGLVAIIAHG
jgi:DNA-binding CsgD family transcriptional regulator